MADPAKASVYVLPQIMDLKAASAVAERIVSYRGRPLTLDASRVERIGGLCLQVLLSARLSWKFDCLALTIANPSAIFSESLELFGAPRFSISKTS